MVTAAKKVAADKSTDHVKSTTVPSVNLRLAANNAAMARIRDAHLDEFYTYLGEECAARGIEWERPLSPKEKARKQILDLIAKNGGDVIPTQDEVAAALNPPKTLEKIFSEEAEALVADEPDASSLVDID